MRPVLHFGSVSARGRKPLDRGFTRALCGAVVEPPSAVTFREYELDPSIARTLPYLDDFETCGACWRALLPQIERDRTEIAASENADVRELVAYNRGRVP